MKIPALLFLIALFTIIGPFITAFLYNHTVPSITGWREIGWWDAFKLGLLFGLLTAKPPCKKS